MPEKQFKINNIGYTLSYGAGQEEQLDRLVRGINSRIEPYAERFAAYSESYLMLLTLLELAHDLEEVKKQNPQEMKIPAEEELRLKNLVHHAESLVKKVQEQ